MESGGGHPPQPIADLQLFLYAFYAAPDPRAQNLRHDLGELLVAAFVSGLCGSVSCAEMAAFGRAKESFFRDFLKLKHAIPSHDTFSEVFRIIDWCLALKANQGPLRSDARACFGTVKGDHPVARFEETGQCREETRTAVVVSAKGLAEHHDLPGLKAFGRIEATREIEGLTSSQTRLCALSWTPTPEVLLDIVAGPLGHRDRPAPPLGHVKIPFRAAGNSTSRSAKTPHATEGITDPATSPPCAAARSTSFAGTPQAGPSSLIIRRFRGRTSAFHSVTNVPYRSQNTGEDYDAGVEIGNERHGDTPSGWHCRSTGSPADCATCRSNWWRPVFCHGS